MKPQEKFSLILSRQGHFRWGDVYTPAIKAVTREAPKQSRISRLNSRKLNRALHLLSTPERVFTQLALYHPRLIDIHEQKMLFPNAHVHPLYGHPLARGLDLNPVEGTLNVAERIGFKHHEITVMGSAGGRRVPYPYIGDLLLYMSSSSDDLYAVNWTVKLSMLDFRERKRSSVKTPLQQKKDRDHEVLRHQLEEEYYLDAGIRTVRVSLDGLNSIVVANLDLLYGKHEFQLSIDPAMLSDFSCEILDAVKAGNPVARVAIKYGAQWGSRDQFLARIYQDIWHRRLLVDMFKPILIDHPLEIQSQDVLEVYGPLFQEGMA